MSDIPDFLPRTARRGRVGRMSAADDPAKMRRNMEVAFMSLGFGYSDNHLAQWFGYSKRTIRRWIDQAMSSSKASRIRQLVWEIGDVIDG